ncbi:universal stress protein [Pseudohalioglobus lutimaris]|nr:universal stress protein [Pseudohalioglobus lutimaris]
MKTVTNIMAAVGLFPLDHSVLLRAAEVARTHQARLTVVHVVERLTASALPATDLMEMQQQLELISREQVVAAVAEQVAGVDSVDIRIETGPPSQQLDEVAKEISADLVVMQANQKPSVMEKIIGSTTDRVIRTSVVPVLVVKRPVEQQYQSIAIAVDPADESRTIGPMVAALFPSAVLHLFHAVYISAQFEEVMVRAGTGMDGLSAHREKLVVQAKKCLRDMARELRSHSSRIIVRVYVGAPADTLVQATSSTEVDLLVIGPGTRSRVRQALLGSVTQKVLQNASCDVLVWTNQNN